MKDCRIYVAAHNTVTLRYARSNPSGPEQSMLEMHFSLFHATGSLPTVHCDVIMQHKRMKCALFKLIL